MQQNVSFLGQIIAMHNMIVSWLLEIYINFLKLTHNEDCLNLTNSLFYCFIGSVVVFAINMTQNVAVHNGAKALFVIRVQSFCNLNLFHLDQHLYT